MYDVKCGMYDLFFAHAKDIRDSFGLSASRKIIILLCVLKLVMTVSFRTSKI